MKSKKPILFPSDISRERMQVAKVKTSFMSPEEIEARYGQIEQSDNDERRREYNNYIMEQAWKRKIPKRKRGNL